jgi:hypothetical protein
MSGNIEQQTVFSALSVEETNSEYYNSLRGAMNVPRRLINMGR